MVPDVPRQSSTRNARSSGAGSGQSIGRATEQSNAHPYFVGVFDTVASLGARGPVRFLLGLGLVLSLLATSMLVAAVARFAFDVRFWPAVFTMTGAALLVFGISSLRSTLHLIYDYPAKGQWNWHIAKWQMANYDQRLPHGIRFARHALAIDETRADFPRVKWGWKGTVDVRVEGQPERFVQLWFSGNHSDIGGSYPEEESRLSDNALEWMLGGATSLPEPLFVDRSRLNVFPSAAGLQHCEVDATQDNLGAMLPRWLRKRWRPTWKVKARKEALGAPMHPSVAQRFDLPGVWRCGCFAPYRPETLRQDERFSGKYSDGPPDERVADRQSRAGE
jgi:uncharacterized protein (DUF2235 family)